MSIGKNDLIRLSIGVVYIWFGLLKFFPGMSPAEELAKSTIDILSFGLISSQISYLTLAIWEVVVGVLLISNVRLRFTVHLALLHMLGTFTPLILFSESVFIGSPLELTLIGQYIIKNLVIVASLYSIVPEQKNFSKDNRLKDFPIGFEKVVNSFKLLRF